MSARESIENLSDRATPVAPLLDAYRTEVLAADGQAYDGELAMYRHLFLTLRVVVHEDTETTEAQLAEVRRRLHQHVLDEQAARADNIEKPAATGGEGQ